ncbi:hypothetical protein LCGC14_2332280, partial [marine sediment metagenome]
MEPAEIFIFEDIGMFGITAQDFIRDLKAVKGREILLHLNTPGGNVFDGLAIANSLKSHPAKVITQ